MRAIVLVAAALIGLAAVLWWWGVGSDEGEAGTAQLADHPARMAQCERKMLRRAPDTALAKALCGCMLRESGSRGLAVRDVFDQNSAEMQEIARNCAAVHGV